MSLKKGRERPTLKESQPPQQLHIYQREGLRNSSQDDQKNKHSQQLTETF